MAVTLIAVPGLFLTVALPAYAFTPETADSTDSSAASPAHAQAQSEAQGVTVAAGAASITVARDGFSATSKQELETRAAEAAAVAAETAARAAAAQQALEASRVTTASFASYSIRSEGDDYPWPNSPTYAQGGGLSPLGYYYGECVDFVAWRMNRDAGSTGGDWRWTWGNLTPGGGNGSAWASAWRSAGRATGSTPVVGAVASFDYNHVAYVQSIPGDGTVVLEEYNWMGSHAYHTRTVPIGEVALFLYPPT